MVENLITFDPLTTSLLTLALVRFLGIMVFVHLFFRKPDTKYIILLLGWTIGEMGTICGLYSHVVIGEMDNYFFSIFAGLGTFLIACGILMYFNAIKLRYVYVGSILLIGYGFMPLLGFNIGPNPGLIAQFLFSAIVFYIVLLKRKTFFNKAQSSYYWLVSLALVTLILTFLFVFGIITPNNMALGFVGTSFVHILAIIYFLNLEYALSINKVRESENRYRSLFNDVPDGIFQINSTGIIVECNKGESKIMGYQRDEIIGKHIASFLHKDYIKIQKQGFPILKKEGYFDAELVLIRKDGTNITVQRTVSSLYDNEGKFIGAVAHSHDITNRKLAEKKINKLNKDLENKVIERTKDLKIQVEKLSKTQQAMLFMVEDMNKTSKQLKIEQDKLSKLNKELEAFSYSVSHDLRAPLRAIDGFTDILIEDYASKLDKEGKRIGSVIKQNAKKMGKLIDDLLDFSRMGRVSMSYSKIDMKNMVNAIYYEVTDEKQRKRIKINIAKLPEVEGDTTMMRQVWINLISNAVKFSSHRKQSVISVTSKKEKDKLTYCIKDNGAGFNMKYVEKVFGVFQRLHSEAEFEGTGVGLALVRRIISRHNGDIWAEGKVDKGATFCLSLPAKRVL